jgi:hypothetical protein
VSWEEQKLFVNGDGPCPNEVIGASSSVKKGHYKRGKALHRKEQERTHNTKKPIQQPSETQNPIHNLKTTNSSSSVHTLLDFLSPKSVSHGSLPYLS